MCGIYVDLNQIRSGETITPEESSHTSAHDRIQARLEPVENSVEQATGIQPMPSGGWLCPLPIEQGLESDVRNGLSSATPWRASDKGILPMGLDEYLQLLDWSGRVVREGKSRCIPTPLRIFGSGFRQNSDLPSPPELWRGSATSSTPKMPLKKP